MGGGGVIGKVAHAASGKLLAIARAPVKIACGAFVVAAEQVRGFLDKTLGGQNFGNGAVGNVGRADSHRGSGQPCLGIGFQLNEHLAGFLVRRRGKIQPGDHIRQRLARHLRRKQPATAGVGHQIARQRRHQQFQIVRVKYWPATGQRLAQGMQLRRLRAQKHPTLPITRNQRLQLIRLQLVERHLHPVAKAQLLAQIRQTRKLPDQGFDMRAFDM